MLEGNNNSSRIFQWSSSQEWDGNKEESVPTCVFLGGWDNVSELSIRITSIVIIIAIYTSL